MRKTILLFAFLHVFCLSSMAQQKIEHAIIITLDGLRWQELFHGMDAHIASAQKDSTAIHKKYWAATPAARRSKMMPFFWSIFEANGSIYGNRDFNVNVNTSNPYMLSYPGYSEIFCGYVDTAINSNGYDENPNTNLLEFLNQQERHKNKVAAFGAWFAFDRILNESRSGIPVVCGYDNCGGKNPDAEQVLINKMKQDAYSPWGKSEALDVFTHYAAFDYLIKEKPRVLYIAYGETDEWAHSGHYYNYLNAAQRIDNWLGGLWTYLQNNKQYKDKTLLIVTTDHGRGSGKNTISWKEHSSDIRGSDEAWFAVAGPGITAKGEVKEPIQLYQKQLAQTIAELLGIRFTCEHPVAEGFKSILVK